jgi:microcystin degradation protein MlrC
MPRPARVAVCGYMNESNALADTITLAHGLDAQQFPGGLASTWEAGALIRRLHELRAVDVVELPVWEFGATGPLDGDDFRTLVATILRDLDTAVAAGGAIDALVVLGHGAGRTTDDLDPDGTFLAAMRAHLGPSVPMVVVLDFHANLSAAMCDAVDSIVAYRTNPHVDIEDRLVEAAEHVDRLLEGRATSVVWARMPMVLPQIAQLTTPDEPFGEVMTLAEGLIVEPVRNVSVLGGFSLGDVPECGMSVCITVDRGHEEHAARVAESLCREAWDRRDRYRLHTVPLDSAVVEALRASRGERTPVILADTADNPGGGAPGNTPFVMRALVEAGVTGAVVGLHCDRHVVNAAFEAGVGATIEVEFNAGSTRPLAPAWRTTATVLALNDQQLVPTRGVYKGSPRHPGRSCALQIDGVAVGITSHKVQCADDSSLHHVGLRPETAQVVVVKSRGHFRAGFDHIFTPEQIIEVGAPGVATVDLWSVPWQHVPRPAFPLDDVSSFEPVAVVHARAATGVAQ